MGVRPRAELRGRSWTLSLQRWRAAPRPGLSSNLGTAPLAVLPPVRGVRRVAARLAAGERLWLAVSAAHGVAVEASTPDGAAIASEVLGSGEDQVWRRFGEGLGEGEVPVLEDAAMADGAWSLEVRIGPRTRIAVGFVRAASFDAAFGAAPQPEGGPAVYEGWRLP